QQKGSGRCKDNQYEHERSLSRRKGRIELYVTRARHRGRLLGAIRCPVRPSPKLAQPMSRVLFGFSPKCAPVVDLSPQRIERAEGLDHTIDGGLHPAFGRKASEQSIPDNQDCAVVTVEIAGIAGMMNAMVGCRVEDALNRAERGYELGVN